jgi:hypothetical protein
MSKVRSNAACRLYIFLDQISGQAKNHSNFLGEVILNLAKLVPYKGQYIEQVFDIKQGKTIKTDKQVCDLFHTCVHSKFPER